MAKENGLQFLEKNLEDIIFETDGCELCQRGLFVWDAKRLRQIRIGNYGIADMLFVSRHYEEVPLGLNNRWIPYLRIEIMEFKKGKIDLSTFLQACRYLKGIKRYMSTRKFNFNIQYKITLIGSKIEMDSFVYLPDLIESAYESFTGFDISLYTFSYKSDGIKFKSYSDYKLINEGF